MSGPLANLLRLARAGLVLAQHGVGFVPEGAPVPWPLRLARDLTWPIRVVSWPFRRDEPAHARVSGALTRLGPSYAKLGQFLATRADVIGPDLAADLARLQDRMAPFAQTDARNAIEAALGGRVETTSPSSARRLPPRRSHRCTRRW